MLSTPEAKWLSLLVWILSATGLIYCLLTIAILLRRRDLQPEGSAKDDAEHARPIPESITTFVICSIIGAVLFAATLPTEPPFSPGQRLGGGFLIGWLITLIVAILLQFIARASRRSLKGMSEEELKQAEQSLGIAISTGLLAIVAGTVWTVLHKYKDDPVNVLVGLALGACFVQYIVGISGEIESIGRARAKEPALTSSKTSTLFGFVLAIIGVSLASAIAVYHEPAGVSSHRIWWLLPVTLGSLGVFYLLIEASLWAFEKRMTPFFFAVLAIGTATYLILHHVIGNISWANPVLIGLMSGFLIYSLTTSIGTETDAPTRLQVGVLSVVVLFTAAVVAFRLDRGFGVALCSIGFLPAVSRTMVSQWAGGKQRELSVSGESGGSINYLPIVLMTCIVTFRLFYEQNPLRGPRADLYVHYTFVGLLFGVVAPLTLLCVPQSSQESVRRKLLGLRTDHGTTPRSDLAVHFVSIVSSLIVGLGIVILPPVLVTLWGVPAIVGMLTGVIASGMFFLVLWTSATVPEGLGVISVGSILVGLPLAALRFSQLAEPLGQMTRQQKIYIVGILMALAILIVFAGFFLKRRAQKSRQAAAHSVA